MATALSDGRASFGEVMLARRSIRDFDVTPVSKTAIRAVLSDAQQAPSNCNSQPWITHIVSGASRDRLSAALHRASAAGTLSPDFSWDEDSYVGRLGERRREQGELYYRILGIDREDADARRAASRANFSFFNAPHVALLFVPAIGDGVRVAADVGMYAQTFLLSLADRGLGGVPQTAIGLFADTVRSTLDVPPSLKLLFGISFGYPAPASPANALRPDRDAIDLCVSFHD
mgnify:CR=1 FL=1